MRYLMRDEDLLDLDGYLTRLRAYNEEYERTEVERSSPGFQHT
jgi:hypothetical protein